ncbi:MAG: hypothetical protein IK109_08370 [Clostridiales bacterium]|nr:hypothetical protein [Clostridiales bacterium]
MQITIDFNTRALCEMLRYDRRKIGAVIGALTASLEVLGTALEEINKPPEPVVVPKKTEAPAKPEKAENAKKITEDTPKPTEVKFVPIDQVAPKKRTEKQERDIAAIKQAYEKKQAEKKTRTVRKDIDDSLIVYARDEQKKTFAAIAKEIGCCEQTVINRYNKAKNGGNK